MSTPAQTDVGRAAWRRQARRAEAAKRDDRSLARGIDRCRLALDSSCCGDPAQEAVLAAIYRATLATRGVRTSALTPAAMPLPKMEG